MRKRILFICGSINQTTQMHSISKELPEFEPWFSPYYGGPIENILKKIGLTEMSVMGKKLANRCLGYLNYHELNIDFGGKFHDYDLIVTCSDLVIQSNIRNKKIVLVQEGMTDPENWLFHVSKHIKFLPRWIASTSTTGLSNAYSAFCVASKGYRDLFIKKGVLPSKIKITGIPNFDNCRKYFQNEFPHKNYVLVCTSDSRETLKYENRKKVIEDSIKIANGRLLIFKLHPNENFKRASAEIRKWAPNSLIYTLGNAEEMIANCDVLITRFSSTVFTGLALGKEVYSSFEIEALKKLTPIQNEGQSAKNIAEICRHLIEAEKSETETNNYQTKQNPILKKYVNLIFNHFAS